jgi:enterochelin esterase-like enzyme
MKHYILIVLLSLAGAVIISAQNTPEGVPATTNITNARYPRILPDSRVVFQVTAPQAKTVQIDLHKKYDLKKNEAGIWTITTDPQGPGFHYYSLIIDGVVAADPASESFYGMSRMASGIEVPAKGIDYYDVKNVPHGDVRSKFYFSKTTNSWRRFLIYTPAGYDVNTKEKYPVLYIIHGGGEDETGWALQGKANFILDNLVSAGKAKKMLIVMVDANVGSGGAMGNSMKVFRDEILTDIIPFVEQNYRASTGPENRALAGLSMGGLQTLYTGLTNTDKFAYIGVFSSGWLPNQTDLAEESYTYLKNNIEMFKKNVKLLFLATGSQEDGAYPNCHNLMKRFDELGIKYQYYDYPGGHTWPVWRDNLFKFAPLLFR